MGSVVYAAIPRIGRNGFGTQVFLKVTRRRMIGDQVVEGEAREVSFSLDSGLAIIDESQKDLVTAMDAWVKTANRADGPMLFAGPFRDDPADAKNAMSAFDKAVMAQQENRERTPEERAQEAELAALKSEDEKKRLERELSELKSKVGKGGA